MDATRSPIGDFALDWTPLRMRRRALGMSMRQVQAVTGINYNSVWRIEHNLQAPTVPQLVGLARCLGTPMYDLFIVRQGGGR